MSSVARNIYRKLPFKLREYIKDRYLNFPIASTHHVNRVYRRLLHEHEVTRSRIDVPPALVLDFATDKNTPEFLAVYSKPNPLVTVCIPTYNKGQLLVDRAINALLNQTYSNIEIIVVGDNCTDNTQELLEEIGDPRIKWLNLDEQGPYPPESRMRWAVAGSTPTNKALDLASGDFICHCDDDDEFLPDKIGKLVAFMQEKRAHFVWHDFYQELEGGEWENRKCYWLELGYVVTSSIFYHRWFKRVHWDLEAWRFGEPGDYNRIRRLKYLGMESMRFPESLIYKYAGQAPHSD